jgi:hypothetical protein
LDHRFTDTLSSFPESNAEVFPKDVRGLWSPFPSDRFVVVPAAIEIDSEKPDEPPATSTFLLHF